MVGGQQLGIPQLLGQAETVEDAARAKVWNGKGVLEGSPSPEVVIGGQGSQIPGLSIAPPPV